MQANNVQTVISDFGQAKWVLLKNKRFQVLLGDLVFFESGSALLSRVAFYNALENLGCGKLKEKEWRRWDERALLIR